MEVLVSTWSALWPALKEYGPWTAISIISMLSALSLGVKLGNGMVEKALRQNPISHPKRHRFFQLAKAYSTYLLADMRITYNGNYCPVRTKIFRDMLTMKFAKWREVVGRTVEHLMKTKADNAEIADAMCQAVTNVIETYSAEWKAAGIPQVVADKFHSWHLARGKVLAEQTVMVASSGCYSSREEKQNAILELHCAMIVSTFLDAERSFCVLNGELSGVKYGELVIE